MDKGNDPEDNVGGSLPSSIEFDICRQLQKAEEAMCGLTNKGTDPKGDVEYIPLLSVKIDIQEWLQDAEEAMCKMQVEN